MDQYKYLTIALAWCSIRIQKIDREDGRMGEALEVLALAQEL